MVEFHPSKVKAGVRFPEDAYFAINWVVYTVSIITGSLTFCNIGNLCFQQLLQDEGSILSVTSLSQ